MQFQSVLRNILDDHRHGVNVIFHRLALPVIVLVDMVNEKKDLAFVAKSRCIYIYTGIIGKLVDSSSINNYSQYV